MSDIVERLRYAANRTALSNTKLFDDAADEIERLRIEYNELVDANDELHFNYEASGKWIPCKSSISPYGNDVKCSECGHRMGSSFGYKYCPNCGTRMKSEGCNE